MKKTNEEMRELARKVAENPNLADLIGSTFFDISKFGKRRLDSLDIAAIDEIDEDEMIPADVRIFLKKKRNVARFIDCIRDEILEILYSDEEIATEVIIRYSTYFNVKNLKNVDIKNDKITRMILIICMEKEKVFLDVCEADIKQIEYIHNELRLSPSSEEPEYLRAVMRVGDIIL